jgi:hypothetical protein
MQALSGLPGYARAGHENSRMPAYVIGLVQHSVNVNAPARLLIVAVLGRRDQRASVRYRSISFTTSGLS